MVEPDGRHHRRHTRAPGSAPTHPPPCSRPLQACPPAHRPRGRPRAQPLPGRSLLPPSGCQGQRRWSHRPPQENPAAGSVTRGLQEPTGILDRAPRRPSQRAAGSQGAHAAASRALDPCPRCQENEFCPCWDTRPRTRPPASPGVPFSPWEGPAVRFHFPEKSRRGKPQNQSRLKW